MIQLTAQFQVDLVLQSMGENKYGIVLRQVGLDTMEAGGIVKK